MYESCLKPGDFPCIITGYPVKKNSVHFSKGMFLANKDMWAKISMAAKIASDSNLQDILNFIIKWCGSPSD